MDGGEHIDMTTGEVTVRPTMPPAIAAAIIAVKKQVKQLGADDKNEHGHYNFVSVDKFYERIGKLMAEAGLALLIDETVTDVRGNDKTGNPWLFAQYDLTFMHENGALSHPLHRSIALPISGPQAFGAAQSYIEKQFLRQVFKVPTGDKDADDTAPGEGAPESRNAARTAQGSPPAATTRPGRQQAAPAPSEAQADSKRRYREIRDEIDASMTIPAPNGLDGIMGSPAWLALDKLIHDAEPQETADHYMGLLADRIEKRRSMLAGETEGGY